MEIKAGSATINENFFGDIEVSVDESQYHQTTIKLGAFSVSVVRDGSEAFVKICADEMMFFAEDFDLDKLTVLAKERRE